MSTRDLAVCLLVAVVGACPEAAVAQESPSRFEPAACPFGEPAWIEAERIECGYLVVPERRDGSSTRTLRIAVAVVPSSSPSPRPDPIVYVQGGPGYPSLRYVRSMISGSLWRSLRAERDVVFVDQRGTGFSEPEFCVELNDELHRVYFQGLDEQERHRRVRGAMAACRDRMLAMGVDLGAYHSAAAALDLADLRVALGYDEWNLYGLSYGTRLALIAMRDTPNGIRSVVLSSVIPPNAPERPLSNYRRALDEVFARCAADDACGTEYPDLEARFYRVLDSLEAKPLEVVVRDTTTFPGGVVAVDGDLAAAAIFQALYSPAVIRYVPLVVRVFEERRDDVLALLIERIGSAQASSRGLFLSVECYERAPYLTAEGAAADAAGAPGLAPYDAFLRPFFEDCDAWHGLRASPAELDAVTSDIPTLILSGTLDPITPPGWGRLAASTLSNSVYLEAYTGGHGTPGDECTFDLVHAFIEAPTTPPSTDCNDTRAPLRFVTGVRLSGGMYRMVTRLREGPGTGTVAWIGATLLVLLSAAMAWPLNRFVRLRRARQPDRSRSAVAVRWVASLAVVTALGFLFGLTWIVVRTARTAPLTLAFGVPQSAAPLFLLPWAVVLLGAVLLTLATAAWLRGRWSTAARIHYILIALACLSFVGFLVRWRLV